MTEECDICTYNNNGCFFGLFPREGFECGEFTPKPTVYDKAKGERSERGEGVR